ncbi:hypothetical protein ABT075_35690 [Streptomyces sp. NPDC002677]|uniref:hypothetical protein n=1 Tax=Streptomyces sp. NPDC002677 TaxID=3154774 RepID=UPI0033214775
MQWTGDSGAGYGEEPYAGVGYGYAHGHEGTGGGITADPATAEPEPWTAGATLLIAGPDHLATTERDSPHGAVITVLPTDLDDSGRPASEPDTSENDPARPVFVDASGRRQRRVRRTARLLLIPAGVYVALLVSALLGGPTISAPFVPLPDTTPPAAPRATAPGSPGGTGHAAGSAGPGATDENALATSPRTASGQTGRPTAAATPATTATTAAPTATTSPTAVPTTTTTATATASATTSTSATTDAPSAKGRANAASHKPVK